MMIFEEIEPGPAKRLIGYQCDHCGKTLLYSNPLQAEGIQEMLSQRMTDGGDGGSRPHVCTTCLNFKITGTPEKGEG